MFSFNSGDAELPARRVHHSTGTGGSSRTRSSLTSLERSAIVAADLERDRGRAGRRWPRSRLLRRRFVGKSAVSALLFSPLVVPYLVFGISLLVIFTAVDKFLTATTGNYIGLGLHAVIIGHVVVSLPYTVLAIMPLLERLSVDLDEAAKDLGANAWGRVPSRHLALVCCPRSSRRS